jgi:hypothetical protein
MQARKLIILCGFMAVLIFSAGCAATPKIQLVSDERLIRSDLLSFIRDGMITREEVLLKLGTPSAQFEGQRILTYSILLDKDGKAHLFWPGPSNLVKLTHKEPVIYSLVLVFGPNGLLEKHSLVGAK